MRRLLRLVAWNAGLALAALVLMALAGEAWLRLTKPFMSNAVPTRFVPEVGHMLEPNAEVRWTNGYDFWPPPGPPGIWTGRDRGCSATWGRRLVQRGMSLKGGDGSKREVGL